MNNDDLDDEQADDSDDETDDELQQQIHDLQYVIQQVHQQPDLQNLILHVQYIQDFIQEQQVQQQQNLMVHLQQTWHAEDGEVEILEMFHGDTALTPTFAFKLHDWGHIRSDENAPCGERGRRGLADHNYVYTYGRHTTFDVPDVVEMKDQMWAYNVSNCSWKLLQELTPTPEHFRYSEVFLASKYLFVLQQSDLSTNEVLHVYDLRNAEWLVVHMSGTLPPHLLGQCCTMVNSSIYLYGGIAELDGTHLFQLNLKDFIWNEIVTEEPPSYECCQRMTNDGVYLYVFGCGNNELDSGLVDVSAFDIAAAKWFKVRTKPDPKATIRTNGISGTIEGGFPRSRCGATFVQMNNDVVYLCGGFTTVNFKDIWRFDMKTRSWFRLPCRIPRGNYCITVMPNGCMHLFQNDSHNVRKIWLAKVTLKEMCWQALLHYIGSDKEISKTQWQELGLPPLLLENLYEK